jgi:hypothetical protein
MGGWRDSLGKLVKLLENLKVLCFMLPLIFPELTRVSLIRSKIKLRARETYWFKHRENYVLGLI